MRNNIGEARRSYATTREDGKFSQEDAANYFGVNKSTYQKWEQGTGKTLNLETLCQIADLYGVSVDYLLCMTDKPDFKPERHPGSYELAPAPLGLAPSPTPAPPELTVDEAELVRCFRSMSDERRARLLESARDYAALSVGTAVEAGAAARSAVR